LAKLDRTEESAMVMKEALPLGTITEIHMYGRQLLMQKKVNEAFDVFEMNYKNDPKSFMTNFGLARAYSAKGDFKKAEKYMKNAVNMAPDKPSKDQSEAMLKMLKDKKDIN